MKVEGDAAKGYDVVRLDSHNTVNQGMLLLADTDNGKVKWVDRRGDEAEATLDPHNIRLVSKSRYGRG